MEQLKAITFPEANMNLAEEQYEYNTLPAWADVDENKHPIMIDETTPRDPNGQMVVCFELTDQDIENFIKHRKVYYVGLTFWKGFQPMSLYSESPFIKQ